MKSELRYLWLAIGLGSMVYLTNYTDKVVMSSMGPHVIQAYHFSKIELGVIFTAFALTYTFLQVPIAWWADRTGHRRGVAAMTAFYGVFTVLSGMVASNLGLLTAVRALVGVGEAASMPAVTGGLTKWVPKPMRGLSQGVMHAFTRVGAAITLPVSVFALLAWGIGGPFLVFGAFTLLVSALWYGLFRDRQLDPAAPTMRWSWRHVFENQSLWALCLADFCYFYTLTIYLTWLPSFLVLHRHFTLLNVGIWGGLPFLGGALGGLVGGRISDYYGRRTGNMAFWRRIVPCVGMLGSVALLLPAAFSHNQAATIALFTASFFFLDATISVFWAIAMDIGGPYAGTVAGVMNTWANIGGIVSPLVFGILVQWGHSWTLPFLVASALMVVGSILVWWIRPAEPLFAIPEGLSSPSLSQTSGSGN
ncbi:MAG: MFS transporter [Firmicutes bacterium]|nr:MFS transporter [Bacillota bacterium]